MRGLGPLLSRRQLLQACAVAVAFPFRTQARAGQIAYSSVDRATVRVITLTGVDLEEQKKGVSVEKGHRFAVARGGHGSGILLSPDGLVLTARHVVEKAHTIVVRKPGSKTAYPARPVFVSKSLDYAIIAASGDHPECFQFPDAAPPLALRQPVQTVGYPLDATRDDPQSSQGIIAGELADGSLQLDMAVNPGNSGGPLINMQEQLVGVVVARGRPELGIQSIGFAVPLTQIMAGYTKVKNESRQLAARSALSNDKGATGTADLVDALIRTGSPVFAGTSKSKKKRKDEDTKDNPRQTQVLERIEAALKKEPSSDVLALGSAVLWNEALAANEAARIGWRSTLDRAVSLAKQALELDPVVEKHSPLVTYALYWGPQL